MSKRTRIIVIAAVALIVIVAIVLLIARSRSALAPTTTNSSPFGASSPNSNATYGSGYTNTDTGQTQAGNLTINALTQLTTIPVAGATSFATTTAGTTTTDVRYIERATGHVYDINLGSGEVTETTNTTIPKIYQALWFNNGKSVVLRYLAEDNTTIDSYTANIIAPKPSSFGTSTEVSTLNELQGTFLPSNIEALAIAPNGSLFYITGSAGSAEAYTAASDGSKKFNLFSSALSEWQTTWPEANTIAITTKPSSGVTGVLDFVNPKTGIMQRILGDVDGLTTLTNPKASLVAFSDDNNNLQIYNVKTGIASATNLQTLPEKCVWSLKNSTVFYCAVPNFLPAGNYPDAWYQGLVSFNDDIYKIDTAANTSTVVGSLTAQYKETIDAINLSLTPNEDSLLFTNKKDLTLWSLKLPL